jgi:hypothetical protein
MSSGHLFGCPYGGSGCGQEEVLLTSSVEATLSLNVLSCPGPHPQQKNAEIENLDLEGYFTDETTIK